MVSTQYPEGADIRSALDSERHDQRPGMAVWCDSTDCIRSRYDRGDLTGK